MSAPSRDGTLPELISQEDNSPLTLYIDFSAGRYFDNIEIRRYENNIEYPIMLSWLFWYIAETRYDQNIVDIEKLIMIHWPKMSLSPIGEAAILIMEAAILDGGTVEPRYNEVGYNKILL